MARVVAAQPALLATDVPPGAIRQHLARRWIPIAIALATLTAGLVAPLAGLTVLLIGRPVISAAVGRRAARFNRG